MMQGEASTQQSSRRLFRYSPWHPAYWTIFCRFTLICSLGLILDWIIGQTQSLPAISSNYFSRTAPTLSISPLNLITYITIFALFPFLNDDVDGTPFFTACLIKILLYMGASYYTVLGSIAGFVLGLVCSIVIGTVLVLNIFFGTDQPLKAPQLFLFAFGLVALQIIIDIAATQTHANGIQILLFFLTILIALALMQSKAIFIGALLLAFIGFFDLLVFSLNGSGFGAGGSIISIGATILLLKHFPKKD